MIRTLLALALVTAAFGADVKADAAKEVRPLQANEQLPWCRVTLKMGAPADGGERKTKDFDGWYDAETHLLFALNSFTDQDVFATTPLNPDRIVKVQVGSRAPKAMPDKARAVVNEHRAKKSAAK